MTTPIPINIAVEDELLETMAARVLSEIDRNYATGTVYNRGGFGYLKKNIRAFNSAARAGTPFLVMTDLDTQLCPARVNSELAAKRRAEPKPSDQGRGS